ncbi:ABC transporter ATP-binding protein [Brucella sp. NBRC 12950]|uniref:ABC transporter ATP-binding protein n=1 Tax=Brucella sp. NBRC 12950 TaxID=2994518 RepID=UPI0024A2E131|nr:ABC transporter ATP-binding protein [Brucella sp. NBRC 12950]GLU29830.1 spermidine/putrescine import ATP-binding protein PotA [Brucella sp. NBRC 12950]
MVSHVVELNNIQKYFGELHVLKDIELKVKAGEIVTLLGPSGCGKTTLMRLVAGFENATSGDIIIDGNRVVKTPPEKRPVNMVFQRYALFPHLDVFDNIAFGLRLKKCPESEVRSTVRKMLDLVQLGDFADRWIGQLSGGQAQRVALARALANQPAVLLLDEPLAALDLKIRQYMVTELKRIHQETGTTFLYVTHDQDEAMMLSDRIVLMNKGRIEQIGSPEEMYAAPRTLFCAKFLGDTNIIPCQLRERKGDECIMETPGGSLHCERFSVVRENATCLALRPEAISVHSELSGVSSDEDSLEGVVTDLMFIGSRILYTVRVADTLELRCQEHRPVGGQHFKPGDYVYLKWKKQAAIALADLS